MEKQRIMKYALWALAAGFMIAALGMIFFYVPTEQSMGVVQRIFYFHVPVAWIALLSYVVVFVASIGYLKTRDERWDAVAASSAEIGFIFTTMFLITGMIWAKPAWGVWWTWSPRLTSALVLWFIYVAYLVVRGYAGEGERAARFSSVVGIIGFLDVPVVILSITLWRTQHPSALIFEGGLAPSMLVTLQICIVAFTLLFVLLMIQAVAVKNDARRLRAMRQQVEMGKDRGGY